MTEIPSREEASPSRSLSSRARQHRIHDVEASVSFTAAIPVRVSNPKACHTRSIAVVASTSLTNLICGGSGWKSNPPYSTYEA